MTNNVFMPSDILVADVEDKEAFSVVACDQYTSQPDYWEDVKKQVSSKPSALNMIFPEIYLKTADFEETIKSINSTMEGYLKENIFKEYKNSLFYIKRTLKNGSVRKGIVGMVDLEAYDFSKGSGSLIRATEGTVLERIPPRVKIRENASLELPHVMLLIDDEQKSVIEPLEDKKDSFKKVYSFDLMQQSGHIEGYKIDDTSVADTLAKIADLSKKDVFDKKYGVSDKDVLLFAVGDGNHSLATAKQCYENLKAEIGSEIAKNHPARYALIELVNLYDDSLEFEAIHRVVFNISQDDIKDSLFKYYDLTEEKLDNNQYFDIVLNDKITRYYIKNPKLNLPVGNLQDFLDSYIAGKDAEVDYIHGEDVVKELCKSSDTIGFLLPCMNKDDLFKTVILDGALPRKTFSMGEACDKRFYFEARKIK